MSGIFVDRDNEMGHVDRLVRDNAHRQRMAIVCAPDRMGKTALLDAIYDRYDEHTAVASVDIEQTDEILQLVENIAKQLEDRGMLLPSYRHPVPPSVAFYLSNVQAKRSRIEPHVVFDSMRDEADRRLHALLADIAAAPSPLRVLVLVDGYEHAQAPLRKWLIGCFIPSMLFQNAAVCVLAGCQEPRLTHPQQLRSDRLLLRGLNEEAIDRWLDLAGLQHERRDAIVLRRITFGVPGDLKERILTWRKFEEGDKDS